MVYTNCYFFGTSSGNVYIQTPKTTKSIGRKDLCVFVNGNKEIVFIKDMESGAKYYPAADCKVIQDWEAVYEGFTAYDAEGNKKSLNIQIEQA